MTQAQSRDKLASFLKGYTRKPSREPGCIFWVFSTAVVLSVFCGIWVFKSYQEAQAYNRLTGANVTTWDALWVELRVQEGPK